MYPRPWILHSVRGRPRPKNGGPTLGNHHERERGPKCKIQSGSHSLNIRNMLSRQSCNRKPPPSNIAGKRVFDISAPFLYAKFSRRAQPFTSWNQDAGEPKGPEGHLRNSFSAHHGLFGRKSRKLLYITFPQLRSSEAFWRPNFKVIAALIFVPYKEAFEWKYSEEKRS